MPSFGTRSKSNLDSAHKDLQTLFNEVIKHYDCSVICGYRNEIDQNKAYHDGRSSLKFPQSKHNSLPSRAVDVVPYFKRKPNIRWDDKDKFYEFAGFVQGVAAMLNIKIRCGHNWDMDDELHDSSFIDLPHYELE